MMYSPFSSHSSYHYVVQFRLLNFLLHYAIYINVDNGKIKFSE